MSMKLSLGGEIEHEEQSKLLMVESEEPYRLSNFDFKNNL